MVWDGIDREKLSPMMRHYVSIKEAHPDCMILYRLGDFYELFFDDAIEGSRTLELTLTSRDCGLEERCPMAGVPHHVIETYAARLVNAGKKVCLVDQIEDPREAVGLVKRAITRILTPGTLTDAQTLDASSNNFLMVVYVLEQTLGIARCDLSTGALSAGEVQAYPSLEKTFEDWMESIDPSEIALVDDAANEAKNDVLAKLAQKHGLFVSRLPREASEAPAFLRLTKRIAHVSPKLKTHPLAVQATLSLLDVAYAFREEALEHLTHVAWMDMTQALQMNASTREHLELLHNLEDGSRRDTLFDVLNRTRTAMGARKLAQWIAFPLVDVARIERRQDGVGFFVDALATRLRVRELLDPIYDLERLLSRLSYRRGNARDLLNFAHSLAPIPELRHLLEEGGTVFSALLDELNPFTDLREEIERAIVDEPPISVNEGGMIRKGYDDALDQMRRGSVAAQDAILAYEAEERERTGIKNLRIVYRKNQGYFIEITRSNADKVPEDYHRRQTLKNAERYTSDPLEAWESQIVGSAARIEQLEYELFTQLRDRIGALSFAIQQTADCLATVDVLQSLATCADENGYVRPTFVDDGTFAIEAGRHPVVERHHEIDFIANDLELGSPDNRIQLITGPNMAGKSTYMRQNALIVIMAQLGSYVPARSCRLSITDRLFTRIGARDHLARGESTFMVEMKEMADILREATSESFLILDEVGRGTSTNDGLSIAYAILEYLADHLAAKTLFATHYHELTELAAQKANIENRTMQIAESANGLVFLRKVIAGYADRSYGIEVARLSGMPKEILDRADALLERFDASGAGMAPLPQERARLTRPRAEAQFFQKLARIDVNRLTPLEALSMLQDIAKEARALEGESDDSNLG
ncbi:MAG: DNA mismatch repair protein MutS [Peptoniphilaceae bacterium]|nr:DNA mismatch repair protein MutS [Peptoniphilaceae bacterium]MDY6086034.1 DNA mismatch repair protein MutS [Peptoniphilaceae bacterium]